jgi:hypothetical protein
LAGADPNTSVWWVEVRGHFRWAAQAPAEGGAPLYAVYEADGRDYALYASDGTAAAGRLYERRQVGAFPAPELRRLPDFGTTVRRLRELRNADAAGNFLAAYNQGAPGRWELSYTTMEGQPVSNQIYYPGDGQVVYFVDDTTQDKFGPRRAVEYRCEEMVGMGGDLELHGCTPVGGGNQVQPLPVRRVSLS